MKVGIIDADLLGRRNHRFPNLVCMKIAAYHKRKGDTVTLITDCSQLEDYGRIYEAKVFTDTPDPVPDSQKHVQIFRGGTGYYFDRAAPLPYEIEHEKPDYTLYDGIVKGKTDEYTQFSIGYLTRGCFRKCPFCVNQKYSHTFRASPLGEFMDDHRPKICLLDDNFLAYRGWEQLINELIDSGKPFYFKQGLDERLLDARRCKYLFNAKYCSDYTFAFDDIRDYELIESRLQLIRQYTDTASIRFYVLCGYKGTDHQDISDMMERVALLFRYGARPYIMRYQSPTEKPYLNSPWAGLYTSIARWANQPSLCKTKSFREFCEMDDAYQKAKGRKTTCASMRALTSFEAAHPDIARKYFDIRFQKWK